MTPPHTCTQEGRFDRVESVLDEIRDAIRQITDLMVSSARVDEQIKAIHQLVSTLSVRLTDLETRVRPLESTNSIAQWIERVVLSLVSGAIVYFATKGG